MPRCFFFFDFTLPPSALFGFGHVMYVVLTFVPAISRTLDWMSLSVSRLICPFFTVLPQICKGFDLRQSIHAF